jgi:hypothetical protein
VVLKKYVFALALTIALGQSATAQNSFADRINRLEASRNLPQAANNSSILERLARIEFAVYGQSQQGSILSRIQNLENQRQAPALKETPAASSNTNHAAPPVTPVPTLESVLKSTLESNLAPQVRDRVNQTTPAPGALATMIRQAHVTSVVTLPDIYPPRFFHIPLATETSTDNSDYLNNVMQESKGKTLRFQKMPIPFYITPIQEAGFPKAIREAFDDWTVRTSGLVKFVEVKNKDEARIIIVFNHLGLNKNAESLGAHTVAKWKARGSGRLAVLPVGSIPVPLYIPSVGPKYSVPPQMMEINLDVIYDHDEDARLMLLKNITTHEAGHAMGMLGHSQNKADMMYAITDEHSRLSQRDINTLTRLYQRKVDIPL